eukprot:g755.t1
MADAGVLEMSLRTPIADLAALRTVLESFKPHLLWFVGHGDINTASRKTLGFVGQTGNLELFDPETIANLLGEFAAHRGKGELEAAAFNACSTGGHPVLIADLVRQHGIRFVLFWETRASDDAGPFMAKGFFESIAGGSTYAEAFKAGCQCITEQKAPADARLLTPTNPCSLPPNVLQRFELVDPACTTVVQPHECGQLDMRTWEFLICQRNPRSPEELAYKNRTTGEITHNWPGSGSCHMAWASRVRPGEQGEGRIAAGVPQMYEFKTVHNIPFAADANYVEHKAGPASGGNSLIERIQRSLHQSHAQQNSGSGSDSGSTAAVSFAALTQLAASGLGGIGKTAAVVQMAHAEVSRGTFDFVLWASAESAASLQNDFMHIARAVLKLPQALAQSADAKLCKQAVLDWLQTTDKRWLLVLDNADDLKPVRDYLPTSAARSGCGHVVMTTRVSEENVRAELKRDMTMLTLQKLPAAASRELLLRSSGQVADAAPANQALDGLVAELDGLPLALVQAGALMQQQQCGFSEYLSRYRKCRTELFGRNDEVGLEEWLGSLNLNRPEVVQAFGKLGVQSVQQVLDLDDSAVAELVSEVRFTWMEGKQFKKAMEELRLTTVAARDSVATTWTLSTEMLGAAARELLRVISLLAAEGIPRTYVALLAKCLPLGNALRQRFDGAGDNGNTVDELLARLHRLSLVSYTAEKTISMHRLVQQVQRDEILALIEHGTPQCLMLESVIAVIMHMASRLTSYSDAEYSSWKDGAVLLQHGIALCSHSDREWQSRPADSLAGLVAAVAKAADKNCNYQAALEYHKKYLEIVRQTGE